MPLTFASNYKEIFASETVAKIEDLVIDSYALEDILDFIDANSEELFVAHYEDYVSAGENIGYEAVDAFVEHHGIECVEYASEAYHGEYSSAADFAEEFTNEIHGEVPSYVVVDWQATWDQNLRYDFDFLADAYVFSSNF